MSFKPKNLSDAIKELEQPMSQIKDRLETEMHKLEETLKTLSPHLEQMKDKVGGEVKKAKAEVEHQVQQNPWAALGIVGLIFFIFGFLLGHKNNRG